MRNQIVMLFALLISVASFAQKDEIKAAEKAVKKGDFAAALTGISLVYFSIGISLTAGAIWTG